MFSLFSATFKSSCYGSRPTEQVVCPTTNTAKEPNTIPQNKHKESNISNNTNPLMTAQLSLDTVVYADTKKYIPNITCGKVVKVYDGDTITIANHISLGSARSDEIYRFQVRLNGIDTPEIKSKNQHTKELAKKVRDLLSEMIFGKIVELKNVEFEKFGRLLADVYLGDLHLNQWLIDNGHAVRYDGGTKRIPEEWEA